MENVEYKGYNIKIEYDDICENPREWDNIGTMVCFHGRYKLGDEHNYNKDNYNSWDELEEAIKKDVGKCIILPLFLYDHSGLSLRTYSHGVHASWDGGYVGFIYCTYAKAKKEFILKKGDSIKKRITKVLESEIETYSSYLNGEVYSFTVENKEGENVDSCGGWYNIEEAIAEAKRIIDYEIKENELNLCKTKTLVFG